MGAKFSNSFNFNATMDQAVNLFRDGTFAIQMKFNFLSELPMYNGVQFNYNNGVTFTSWGEDISIVVSFVDPNTVSISVLSECSLPTQIIDWGKNRRNVDKIFQYIGSNIARYATPFVNAPVSGSAQSGPCKYCGNCGAPLNSCDRFCNNCGQPQ